MSKIIVLVGSVRKNGNTELLANAFYKGAIQNNDVEVISVADYKVNPCIGGNSRFEREGNRCFQQDAGMVLVRGVKDKGDIENNMALTDAFKLGDSLR